jgi:hypothetical protein
MATPAVVVHDRRDLDGHHAAAFATAPVDFERNGASFAGGAGERPHVTHQGVRRQHQPEIAGRDFTVVEEPSVRVVGVHEVEGLVAVHGDHEGGVRKEVEQLRAVEGEALDCFLP